MFHDKDCIRLWFFYFFIMIMCALKSSAHTLFWLAVILLCLVALSRLVWTDFLSIVCCWNLTVSHLVKNHCNTLMLLCFYKLWQQQYNACVLKMLLGLQLQQECKCKCLAKWISPRNSIRNHKTPRMTDLTRHLWLLSNVATWWINIKCVLHNGFVRVRTIHFIIGLYIS